MKYKKIHKILWWNEPDWLKELSQYNNMNMCEYTNCEVIYDKKLIQQTSTIIISIVYMHQLRRAPVFRHSEQTWIFFTYESPPQMSSLNRLNSPQWLNVFNWSWTYRQDSDIFSPYGSLVELTSMSKRNYSDMFRKKRKMAAWLVSKCHPSSQREKYVKLLQTFIDVDIYGRCGNPAPDDILDRISEEYFFYLGFENSFCKDYVTEKFFKYYNLDAINVVRGDFEYNKHLPKGSFINTADFYSVKLLAEFMLELSTDEEAYTNYIRTKDKFKGSDLPFQDNMCQICEKINNMDNNKRTYKNVREWLGNCRAPNDLILEN